MDKKYKDMSYRQVHKKLEEAMQDALTSDEAGPFGSPEIDYSFIDSKSEKKSHKWSGMSRFNKVAAIIVIVLLGMNVVMMATGSGVSYSEKGLLHRIYEGARGIFTDEDESEYVEIDETGRTYTITDADKIDEAKNIYPNLYIPQYIPERYKFAELIVEENIADNIYAKYTYLDSTYSIEIAMISINHQGGLISKNTDNLYELEDRLISVYWDDMYRMYVADIYFEDVLVNISGDINKDEILEIAKSIVP